MKKSVVILLAGIAISSVQASLYTWNSAGIFENIMGLPGFTNDYDGAGWFIEVLQDKGGFPDRGTPRTDLKDSSNSPATNTQFTLGWWTEDHSYGINSFKFEADAASSVVLRLYDNAIGHTAVTPYNVIESLAFILHASPMSPADFDVAFDFTGQEWQAVPEPGTMMLLIPGMMGAFAWRRRKAILQRLKKNGLEEEPEPQERGEDTSLALLLNKVAVRVEAVGDRCYDATRWIFEKE